MTNENTTQCTGWCTPKDEKRNVQSTVLTTFLFSFFDYRGINVPLVAAMTKTWIFQINC